MRLVSYVFNEEVGAGLQSESLEYIFPLAPLGYADTLSFLYAGEDAWAEAAEAASAADLDSDQVIRTDEADLLAPIAMPGKFICIGLNYRDHAIESNMQLPKTPVVFTKFSNCITGDNTTVVIPSMTTQLDYEAELAIVIGREGKNIPAEDWADYVFGYTIVNDLSARDIQLATSQWSLGKSFDGFGPMGPAIVSKDDIPDPHVLGIKLSIDGEVLQDSNTDQLVFKAPDLIAYLSSIMTLEPGDIISTGTPAGVGLGRKPQRWIQPGETMVVEIEGIGTLTNNTVAE
ncbi:2-keto-4-pentenoate hydratase/2-oxohepta-3-ene-1,7-dioic acid hydratase (catechol pathway) [Granulicella pectinivorans]|jgi:2-keto-4-pentenoate hydratase/2-oxohepta-3-ene-1,7-dioic acid hydratase in catechol pathway|uniref:2-keto-4-pentenoate hydratase/2-oxohepta-3-ene-1,7-dioic acid hydratase (Catechol pathway) n=1 Tax=Granulicella pectinivorans TaxID=474950 RepID=A0A1I6L8U9_9BACT|nr:fumarylacetoacetate hydrolase family protein [Granulicella pectinivorans]SFR99933.1 2-keto-4-pentenoate hydratase/2-oxohepta-3-ene-1,7-dioic acid hydratase (catechol pathway) [Granulicella pectinivorans]